jgi:hypothetical protein
MAGAEKLLQIAAQPRPPQVRVVRAPCVGRCDTAPIAEVGHYYVDHANPAAVAAAVAEHRHAHRAILHRSTTPTVAAGGYALLERACAARRRRLPTGRKWRSVLGEPGPRLMAVNGDEGEPGTFKDRYFLETDPHRFLEGMLIGAHVVEAPKSTSICATNTGRARNPRPARSPSCRRADHRGCIHLRRGAGAYICGEESAMLESIEGKRGLPRHKPPFPFQVGLFGRPTLINNVETLWWVRDIVEKGAGLVEEPGPQRPQGPAQLFGVGPGQESRA